MIALIAFRASIDYHMDLLQNYLLTMNTNHFMTKRSHCIDFLKGICIVFVVLTHYAWTELQRLQLFFPFWIDMAVPVFMILSGFVFAKSFQKNGIHTLRQGYQIKTIIKRIIRFTVPYLMIFVVEQICITVVQHQSFSIWAAARALITGGYGPGSYYYPVLIQFIFIIPIVYLLIEKFDYKGLLGCIAFNLLFEIMKAPLLIHEELYRLLIFRYVTVIAFGCYFAIGKKKLNLATNFILTAVGIVYIIVYKYIAVTPIIMVYWTGTSMIACMLVVPISDKLIHFDKLKFKPIELLGKASYNIFLVQMAYYGLFANYVYSVIHNSFMQIIASLIICVVLGIAFYYLETSLTKKLLRLVKV